MLFWKTALKQFRSSSCYTLHSTHNFCEGPQPQWPNIAICRPKVLRPCYVWGSHRFRSSSCYTLHSTHNFCEGPQPQWPNIAICRPKVLRPYYVWGSHRYHCFYCITTVSITRLCLLCGNIWRAFTWVK